ncbi:MAG: cytochrome C [Gammaproteobacteria bacterium RIFOXYA12_FULL_61_12]|nr:MAG: cytochrome C [Gammaproteobacteria bacterium RIFOXYA12_FULL_61_12]OGT91302.1 MAG: cytochrome C [Gammaproteobacteria bacterium RIFOXYD12_FULL_61_37]
MRTQRFRRRTLLPLFAFLGVLLPLLTTDLAAATDAAPAKPVKMNSTADHTKYEDLQQVFKSGPEVTKACLKCHTEAAGQIHRTKHWTWEFLNPENGQRLGKKNVMNNFCISISQNYSFCTGCHIGYGWKDKDFDFTSEVNVDCLACHDTTGSYKKPAGNAGNPVVGEPMEMPPGSGKMVKPVDLTKVAQKVGKTSRDNCGNCHFYGGGGDGVKHGDLDSSLASPDKELDVHMDATGLDFSCGTCHKTSSHDVPGSRYKPTAREQHSAYIRGKGEKVNPATCQACHGNKPHKSPILLKSARMNTHAEKMACQVCHIPAFARGGVPTKMSWDWSTAGQKGSDGKHMVKKDATGHVTYDTRKGDFALGHDVVPEYRWFNGDIKYTLLGDKVEKSDSPTPINRIDGSPTDGRSMIWPMKIMRGLQPFDPVNKTLVMPHVAGNDDIGYWKNLEWEKAIADGMRNVNAPFSGKVDFIKTEMYWPITHMVAPKEKVVSCTECHAADSRLKGLPGIYMPGHSAKGWLDIIGWLAALTALLGVLIHGAVRITLSLRKAG